MRTFLSKRSSFREVWLRETWLRAVLWTTAVVVGCLGWWIYTARLQGAAVSQIRALGGAVVYVDDMPFRNPYPAVRWLQRKLGHDYTSAIGQVQLSGPKISSQDLDCLAKLRGLRALRLNETKIDDEALKAIGKHRRLEELSLCGTQITDAGLAELAGLQRLEFLYLCDTQISNAGLAPLESLASLRCLELGRTRVTALGARRLSRALPETRIRY